MYVDVEGPEGCPVDVDLVELKYDGWFCRLVVEAGQAMGYSKTGRELFTRPAGRMADGEYFGEWIHGTSWAKAQQIEDDVVVFDLVVDAPFWDRRRRLEHMSQDFPSWVRVASQWPVAEWGKVWRDYVEGEAWEGVVFKSSLGMPGEPMGRKKRIVTAEYQVERLEQLEFNLVAVCRLARGGGLRVVIPSYAQDGATPGAWVEVEGNVLFESGAVRHPRFLRWRPDKAA